MPGSPLRTPQEPLASASGEDRRQVQPTLSGERGGGSVYTPRSCARLHAPSRKRAWGVQGGVHAFARLHAQEDSRPLSAMKVAKLLKPGRSKGYALRKILIHSGIWRSIVENPRQKISRYSPNLTKYKHTKRARVQSKWRGYPPPFPKRRKWPGRGTCALNPEIECMPARFVCFKRSGARVGTSPQ